jgi:subtilase family serine protease
MILCLLLMCLFISGAQAITVKQDLSTISQRSDDIVYGTIVGTRSSWTADTMNIITTAEVRIDRNIRGRYSGTISVTVPGGTVDGITQHVEDQPVLLPGADVFLFVKQHDRYGTTVVGGTQGVQPVVDGRVLIGASTKGDGIPVDAFYRYLRDLASGGAASVPNSSGPATPPRAAAATPVISGVTPGTASAGTTSQIAITGSGFGTKSSRQSKADVGFLYRYDSDGATPIWASGAPYYSYNANDIVSWTDTRIVVNVPVGVTSDWYPGSASSGYVYVVTDANLKSSSKPFTVTFSYGKEKWATVAPFSVNPGSQGTAAVTAIQNAAGTWNAAIPSSSFRFNYQGTSTSTAFGRNGQSLIYFGPASDFSDDSIIAWANTWTDSSGNIIEADIEFNSKWAWTTGTASGDTMNIEAIVLHELGHWLCLQDLYGWAPGYPSDVGKVMFGYSGDDFGNQNLKTLHTTDRAGIQWIYGGSGPVEQGDLVVTSVDAPASGVAGQTISVVNTVRNQGSASSGGFTIGVYLSSDTAITTADTYLGQRSVSSLAPGASTSATSSVTVPVSTTPGTYYIGVIADTSGSVVEANEANNAGYDATPCSISGSAIARPDLVISSVDAPSSAVAGQAIQVTASIGNQGTASSGAFTLGVYLSPDTSITTADAYLGERSVSALAAGATTSTSSTVTVPASTTPGAYYIGVIADTGGVVAESSEANNIGYDVSPCSITSGSTGTVDLATLYVDGPSTAMAGTTISIMNMIRNQGTGAAGSFTIGFYLSEDAVVTADDIAIGSRSVSSLGASQYSIALTTVAIPTTVPAGSYYIGVIADPSGTIVDSNPSNNVKYDLARCSLTGASTSAPDLYFTTFDGPTTGTSGESIYISNVVKNQGTLASGGFWITYHLSPDATITSADTVIGQRYISGLGIGASASASASYVLPVLLPSGSYYLGGIVDVTNRINEKVESNNIRVDTAKITITGASSPYLAI